MCLVSGSHCGHTDMAAVSGARLSGEMDQKLTDLLTGPKSLSCSASLCTPVSLRSAKGGWELPPRCYNERLEVDNLGTF